MGERWSNNWHSSYNLDALHPYFFGGSYHEKHCFYSTWLSPISQKSLWFICHCCWSYLDIFSYYVKGNTYVKYCSRIKTLIILEWSYLFYRIYGGCTAFFYYNWKTCHIENANVNGRSFCLQKFLYNFWDVLTGILLRSSRHHFVWYC